MLKVNVLFRVYRSEILFIKINGCLQSLDWTTQWTGLLSGLSLKLRAYHCTITCDLFVQCMRQNT